jgi:hypothetical protein
MTAEQLAFPALAIFKDTTVSYRTLESLTTTTAAALRGGFFNGLRIIDSNGVEAVVRSATKLGGVGLFWGFNVFLNQRIRVALILESPTETLTTDQVRQIVLRDFRNWHGWESREDFDQLKDAVKNASTVGEILQLVSEP